ncbi:MAG: hypothetical protein H0W85_06035 [Methylotenera sp.]|nr:hypothetical protein [Methylotenera sp.]
MDIYSLAKHTVYLALFIIGSAQTSIAASDDSSPKIKYKLTTSYYQASDDNNAVDVNLRGSLDSHTAWVGEYGDRNGFRQLRTGYEYSPDYGFLRPTFSIQLASKDFVGGSISTEVGGDTFVIIGIGRTNLHDYYNLNFDPNDAITFGIGTRAIEHQELSVFQVFDDRLGTQQRISHFVWRYRPTDSQRITMDASYKTGIDSDDVFIHGYCLSVDYSFNQLFARVAREQHANFASSDLTRFSIGLHF